MHPSSSFFSLAKIFIFEKIQHKRCTRFSRNSHQSGVVQIPQLGTNQEVVFLEKVLDADLQAHCKITDADKVYLRCTNENSLGVNKNCWVQQGNWEYCGVRGRVTGSDARLPFGHRASKGL